MITTKMEPLVETAIDLVKARNGRYSVEWLQRAMSLSDNEARIVYNKVCKRVGPPAEIAKKGEGKPNFNLLDFDFAAAMCSNFEKGLKHGRKANGWKLIEWNDEHEADYFSALVRHVKEYSESGEESALAAIACNANILHYHRTHSDKGRGAT